MSIILTGMDMQDFCYLCNIEHADETRYGEEISHDCPLIYKGYTDEFRLFEKHPDCPLKSIDVLIEKIERIGSNEEKSVYKNLNPSYVQGLKDAIGIIKEYCEMEEYHG